MHMDRINPECCSYSKVGGVLSKALTAVMVGMFTFSYLFIYFSVLEILKAHTGLRN